MISLSDGVTTITLPEDMQWQDEYDWSPVEQEREYSLSGASVVQQGVKQNGRPITLYGGVEGAWATRQQIDDLKTFEAMANQEFTLALWSRTFNVMFEQPGVIAKQIQRLADPDQQHFYSLTIKLLEV